MQVVIEISEERYNALCMRGVVVLESQLPAFLKALRNGTILPEGHGDLVDRSQALRTDCFGDGHDGLRAFHEYADYAKMREYLQHIPAIIPADKDGD